MQVFRLLIHLGLGLALFATPLVLQAQDAAAPEPTLSPEQEAEARLRAFEFNALALRTQSALARRDVVGSATFYPDFDADGNITGGNFQSDNEAFAGSVAEIMNVLWQGESTPVPPMEYNVTVDTSNVRAVAFSSEYEAVLRRTNRDIGDDDIPGGALLTFRVDRLGRIFDITVEESTSDTYAAAARNALARQHFSTGYRISSLVPIYLGTRYPFFRLDQVEVQPQATSIVDPVWPDYDEGTVPIVILALLLDESGNIESISVEREEPEGFGEVALDAINQWTFTPGYFEDEPVATFMLLPVAPTEAVEAAEAAAEEARRQRAEAAGIELPGTTDDEPQP